ncbi:MAG: cytidylate kinase-like family protein [Chloroflexota bacterium]|jgi:cytidylate kinase
MTIITLSRELGSHGTKIARQTAKDLGYQFVDKRTFERILHQYGLVEFEEVYDSAPGFWARFDRANLQVIAMLNKTVLGIARLGDVVILGRGGYAALHDYADVLHVRIQASFPVRVQRIMAAEEIEDIKEAQSLVVSSDKARAMFVKGFYDVDFYTTSQFHLVLDTGVVPTVRAAAWIAEAASSLAERAPADAMTTQTIEVDPILASVISTVLDEN